MGFYHYIMCSHLGRMGIQSSVIYEVGKDEIKGQGGPLDHGIGKGAIWKSYGL